MIKIFILFLISFNINAENLIKNALIIGNSSYQKSPLKNPINDAKLLATTLKKLNFIVTLKLNANQKDIEIAIDKFGENLYRNKGIGLFFYAGHGIQSKGENYLIPIDSSLKKERDLRYDAVNIGRIFDAMENSKNHLNIVILDACRNNPFTRSFRSNNRGLARLNRTPKGLLIAYSTAPGDVATDGENQQNSPYSAQLAKSIQIPNKHILLAFQDVANKVQQQTHGTQVPWTSSSLTQDFYFNPIKLNTTQKALKPKQTTEIKYQKNIQIPDNPDYLWTSIQDTLKIGGLAPLMTVIPNGKFIMGSNDSGHTEELPLHTVHITKKIAVSRYEVSFSEFDKFIEETKKIKPESPWGRNNQPVINISWQDAIDYADWLSQQTGQHYRLPSESEWEYFSRANSNKRYFWGDSLIQCSKITLSEIEALRQFKKNTLKLCQQELIGKIYANCKHCFSWSYMGKTVPINSYIPNNFGLYNTLGNVAEYTQDCWRETYYGASNSGVARTSKSCLNKVIRGGHWNSSFEDIRVTSRVPIHYLEQSNKVGIRLVRDIK